MFPQEMEDIDWAGRDPEGPAEGTGLWAAYSTMVNGLKFSHKANSLSLFSVEAYDKMEADLVSTKERLMRILQSKDRKATVWLLN